MTQYQEILENVKRNKVMYANDLTGVWFANVPKIKYCADGSLKFFNTHDQMARSINKFLKTGN